MVGTRFGEPGLRGDLDVEDMFLDWWGVFVPRLALREAQLCSARAVRSDNESLISAGAHSSRPWWLGLVNRQVDTYHGRIWNLGLPPIPGRPQSGKAHNMLTSNTQRDLLFRAFCHLQAGLHASVRKLSLTTYRTGEERT
jgi:hypothetical protein